MFKEELMKHKTTIILGIIIAVAVFQAFCQSAPGAKSVNKSSPATVQKENKAVAVKDTTAKAEKRQLIVYYFMTTYRCPSCHFIEETTRKAIDESFAKEIKSGRMVFKMINIEEAGNEHFGNDYKLYTKSVVLSNVKDGKEASWKNLEDVWKMIGQEDSFKAYIVKEVKAYLGA